MKVLLAHPGTQHAPRLAGELEQRQLLAGYWTGLAFAEHSLAARLTRPLLRWPQTAGLATRVVYNVSPDRLHTLPWNELSAIGRLKTGGDSHLVLHERNRLFQEKIPERALQSADAVIGFDTSGWILGERAKKIGRPFILDRTIAHLGTYGRIMNTFNRQYPDWAVPVEDRPAMVTAAEAREHALAARIVVGGRFARDTLVEAGIAPEKIRINPYGVNWLDYTPPPDTEKATRPFRFLYVGSVIARKGIPILLDAWRRLADTDAELWIAGSIGARERKLIPDLPGLKLLGQVPRSQIPALYAQADVFVLPSFFEGFGLVLLEALAAGLPILATPHTGAVELIQDPALGELVTPGSVDALVEAMHRWHAHPGAYRASVGKARRRLVDQFSWQAYGNRWADLLNEKF